MRICRLSIWYLLPVLTLFNSQVFGDDTVDQLQERWAAGRNAVIKTVKTEFLQFSRPASRKVTEPNVRESWNRLDLRQSKVFDRFTKSIDGTMPANTEGYSTIKLTISGDNYLEDRTYDGRTWSIVRRDGTVVRFRPENNQVNIHLALDYQTSMYSAEDLHYLPGKDEANELRVSEISDDRVYLESRNGNRRIVADVNTGFIHESVRRGKSRSVVTLQKHRLNKNSPVDFPAVSGSFTFVDDKLTMCELRVIKTVKVNEKISDNTFRAAVEAGVRVIDLRNGIENVASGRTTARVPDLIQAIDRGDILLRARVLKQGL